MTANEINIIDERAAFSNNHLPQVLHSPILQHQRWTRMLSRHQHSLSAEIQQAHSLSVLFLASNAASHLLKDLKLLNLRHHQGREQCQQLQYKNYCVFNLDRFVCSQTIQCSTA